MMVPCPKNKNVLKDLYFRSRSFVSFKNKYLGRVSSFNSSENNIISAEAAKVLP
jgi:hypothetical protein